MIVRICCIRIFTFNVKHLFYTVILLAASKCVLNELHNETFLFSFALIDIEIWHYSLLGVCIGANKPNVLNTVTVHHWVSTKCHFIQSWQLALSGTMAVIETTFQQLQFIHPELLLFFEIPYSYICHKQENKPCSISATVEWKPLYGLWPVFVFSVMLIETCFSSCHKYFFLHDWPWCTARLTGRPLGLFKNPTCIYIGSSIRKEDTNRT